MQIGPVRLTGKNISVSTAVLATALAGGIWAGVKIAWSDRTQFIERVDHIESATQSRASAGDLRYQELTMKIDSLRNNNEANSAASETRYQDLKSDIKEIRMLILNRRVAAAP